jgi:hypothetical protein
MVGFLQMHELLDSVFELFLFPEILLNFLVDANHYHKLDAKKHSVDRKDYVCHVLEVKVQVVEF